MLKIWKCAAAGALLFAPTTAHAVPLSLYAAGSLSAALTTVAANYTAATGTPVTTTFQPSGTIRQEIEAGTIHPDVFVSADTGNPLTLSQDGLSGPVIDFASNRVVAVAKSSLGLTSGNLLSRLLNPSVTIAPRSRCPIRWATTPSRCSPWPTA